MGTFYLGLSMAGTVSAGTFTGGTLTELDSWLAGFENKKNTGISLRAIKNTPNYQKGDIVHIAINEMPDHTVKIKSMTGASGGGISAALYAIGLSTGTQQSILRDIWTTIDVSEMLDTSDLIVGKNVFSILNVKPIDNLTEKIKSIKWSSNDFAKSLNYIDDNLEIFLTLASLEGIPYNIIPLNGTKLSYSKLRTHLDYIKFNFSKFGTPAPTVPNLPFAYNLAFRKDHYIKDDQSWSQLINSCPATSAFPFGFKPRSLKRYRNEYIGKLFYYNYSNLGGSLDYSTLLPLWPNLGGNNEAFEMEYVDGGTFNREPHDLARASLLQSLWNGTVKSIPQDGIATNATVILIDPFPSNFDEETLPGEEVVGIPDIVNLPKYLVGAIEDQGRFRPDWMEKALNSEYYSRFLISPIRYDSAGVAEKRTLAGGELGAFSGFIDKNYREHDYKLGHFNTFNFLSDEFLVPIDNREITYCQNIAETTLEKYEAIGWYKPNAAIIDGHPIHKCQIIPRTEEPGLINGIQQPEWPSITMDKWQEIRAKALERAKKMFDVFTDFNWTVENVVDPLIWKFILKGKAEKLLSGIEDKLKSKGLLRG